MVKRLATESMQSKISFTHPGFAIPLHIKQLSILDLSPYPRLKANMNESLWQSLEEDMVPLAYTARFNWLESQPKVSPSKKHHESHVCVVGESIKLDIELKNPLHISISVSGISLICDLSVSSEILESDKSSSTSLQDGDLGEHASCRKLSSDASSLTSPELDLVLRGRETKRVELSVTPKVEGVLKIMGVRWKLSGLVGGYQYFEFGTRKKQKKGKKGHQDSSSNDLNFIVIEGLPKLEGCIRNLPKKAFAGDLRLLMLELGNRSQHSLKNMKMKISHPRFLIPGTLEDLNKDFPSCLERHVSSERRHNQANVADKSDSLLFSFPGGTTIHGGSTLVWPLWFHVGISGMISFHISIYYEMESSSRDMIYRILRMHYDVEVLPSLDLSFSIAPCPSRLQDFIVHMDIANKTISESFSLQQLSCIGDQWEISSLRAYDSICPSPVLFTSQAVSCFFKLKDRGKGSYNESNLTVQGSDVLLSARGTNELFMDVSRSPLANFHHHERHSQGSSVEVNNFYPQGSQSTVDFILISKLEGDYSNIDPVDPPKLLSNHVCHCSISCKSPISWLTDGLRTINHDFSTSFCEVTLNIKIHNRSNSLVSIRITTFDGFPESDTLQVSDFSENQGGWHDVQLVSEPKVISDIQGILPRKPNSQSISPYVWCASSSTQLKLGQECTEEIPLRVCIFSPGTYDLSNYEVHWKLISVDGEVAGDLKRIASGMGRGHPFYLTALQTPPAALE